MPKRKKHRSPSPPAQAEWFKERAREVGGSLAEFSLEICGHKDLLGRSLNAAGESKPVRDLRPAEIAALAQKLRVPLVYLFHQLGHKAPFSRVRVVGRVAAAGVVESFRAGELPRYTYAPAEVEIDLIALEVDPAAGLPFAGAVLYLSPPARVEVGAFGRLAYAEAEGGAAYAGVLARASGRGATLRPLAPGYPPIDIPALTAATPIMWVHLG